jgi:hypothetical protein
LSGRSVVELAPGADFPTVHQNFRKSSVFEPVLRAYR